MVTEETEALVIEGYDKFREETGKKYAQYVELYKPTMRANEVCFACKKCLGDCSWSDRFKPISGWVAQKTIDANKIHSYKIFYCPQFEEGDASKGLEYDKDGCYELLITLVQRSVEAYKAAARTAKEEKAKYLSRTVGIHFDASKWKKALQQMQYESNLLGDNTEESNKEVGFKFDKYDKNCLRGMYD